MNIHSFMNYFNLFTNEDKSLIVKGEWRKAMMGNAGVHKAPTAITEPEVTIWANGITN